MFREKSFIIFHGSIFGAQSTAFLFGILFLLRLDFGFLKNIHKLLPFVGNFAPISVIALYISRYIIFIFCNPTFEISLKFTFFKGWVAEYEDDIPTYIECNYGDWSEVADKWQELMDVFKKTEVEPQQEEDTEEESGGLSAKDAPVKDNEGFFAKHFGFKTPGVDEISKDIKSALAPAEDESEGDESSHYTDNSIISTSDTYSQLLAQYDTEATEAELLAKYKTLYSEGGAEIGDALSGLIEDLNDSIEYTAKILSTTVNKTSHKIAKKQCNG